MGVPIHYIFGDYSHRMWFKAKDISYSQGQVRILDGLNLMLDSGKIYAILGVNGAGKSTLLQLLAGLLDPDEGTIHLASDRILGPAYRLVPGHPAIALVKQDSRLHPLHTVRENLIHALRAYEEEYQVSKMEELALLLDLKGNWDKQVKYLSGGEQQRVAIAVALAKEPSLLLLDEPFSQTDMMVKQELRSHLRKIVSVLGVSILFVSHDAQEALSLAEHLFVLHKGGILEEGSPRSLYFRPQHLETAHLTGICNWLDRNRFSLSTQLHVIGESFLLRPDQVALSSNGKSKGFVAKVTCIEFAGLYQLVTFYLPVIDAEIKSIMLSSLLIKVESEMHVDFIPPID